MVFLCILLKSRSSRIPVTMFCSQLWNTEVLVRCVHFKIFNSEYWKNNLSCLPVLSLAAEKLGKSTEMRLKDGLKGKASILLLFFFTNTDKCFWNKKGNVASMEAEVLRVIQWTVCWVDVESISTYQDLLAIISRTQQCLLPVSHPNLLNCLFWIKTLNWSTLR